MKWDEFIELAKQSVPELSNELEKRVVTNLYQRGLTVLRKGWPDFMVINTKVQSGFAIEVKSKIDGLSREQRLMHFALSKFGIPVHTVRPPFDDLNNRTSRAFLTDSIKHNLTRQLEEIAATRKCLEQRINNLREEISLHDIVFDAPNYKTSEELANPELAFKAIEPVLTYEKAQDISLKRAMESVARFGQS